MTKNVRRKQKMTNTKQNKIKKGIIMALIPLVIGTAAYAGQKEAKELASYAQNNADKVQHIREEINGKTVIDGKVYTAQKGGIEVRLYPNDLVMAVKDSSDTAKVLYDYGTDGTLDLIVSGKDVEADDFYKVTPEMIKTAKYVEDISSYQSAGSKWTDDSIKKIYAESMSKDEKSKFNEFYDGLAKIVLDSLKEETK
jgi:hypothetical protein